MTMKEYSNIIAALILAIGIIIAASIYSYANRYELTGRHVVDKHNATYRVIKLVE